MVKIAGGILEGKGKLSLLIKVLYGYLAIFPQLKDEVKSRLTLGIKDEDAAKIIQSMFLGEKFDRSDPVAQDFRLSGAMHVFAVSGLHVMLVAGIALVFLRALRLPRFLAIPLAITTMILLGM